MAEWHRIITSPYTGSMTMSGSFNVDGDATITGNVTINGTASVENLIVKQIGYSSGSNQLGDAANDTQTLYGSVIIPTGSLLVTGSITQTASTASFGGLVNIGTTASRFNLTIPDYGRIGSDYASDSYIQLGNAIGLVANYNVYTLKNLAVGAGDISARLGVKGSGTTSSTTALLVQNANASSSLQVRDDGVLLNYVSGSTYPALETYIDGLFSGIKLSRQSDGFAGRIQWNSQYQLPDNGGNIVIGSSTAGFIHSGGVVTLRTGEPRLAFLSNSNSGKGFYITAPTASNSFELWLHDNFNQQNIRRVAGFSNTNDFTLYQSGSQNALLFVSGSGNVGIGTNTPSVALNVIGHFVQNAGGYGIATNTLLNTRIDYYQYAGHQFRSWGPAGSQNVVTITGGGQRGKVGIMFDNPTASLHVAGDVYVSASAGTGSALTVYKSGSTVVDVQGSSGQLFSVTDSLSGSLFSVNTAAGLPTIEAFSDNTVNIGKFGTYPIKVVSLGTSAVVSGSFSGSGADLSGIPASAIVGLNLSQIATGSVSASVGLGTGSFSIVSGSSNFLFINNTGSIGVSTSTPFSDIPNVGRGSIDLVNPNGNVTVGGFAVLGKTSTNGYGAVGSNYYLDNANAIRRRYNDFFSAIGFEAGGFAFLSAGGGAVGSSISATYLAVLNYLGNFTIGNGSTTLGARIGIKGSGTTSSTTSLLVQNSAGTQLGYVDDSGQWQIGTGTNSGYRLELGSFNNGLKITSTNNSAYNAIVVNNDFSINGAGAVQLGRSTASTTFNASSHLFNIGSTSNRITTTNGGGFEQAFTFAGSYGQSRTFTVGSGLSKQGLWYDTGSAFGIYRNTFPDTTSPVLLATTAGDISISGSLIVTGSITTNSALTASSAIISGNVTVLGTASINTLIVNQTQLSTGSNQLGDAADDFQTLYGTVRIPTGSLTVTGSTNISGSFIVTGGITGSLFGTSSLALTASFVNPLTQSVFISGSTTVSTRSSGAVTSSVITIVNSANNTGNERSRIQFYGGPTGTDTGGFIDSYPGSAYAEGILVLGSRSDDLLYLKTGKILGVFTQPNSNYLMYVSHPSYATAVMRVDSTIGAALTGTYVQMINNEGSYFSGLKVDQGNASTNRAIIANGQTVLQGKGTTSATTTLTVQNANASSSLQVRDNGSTLFAGSNGVFNSSEARTYFDSDGTLRIQRSINGTTYGLRVWNGAGWAGHNAIEALAYQFPIYGVQGSNGAESASPLAGGAAVHGKGGVGVYGRGVTPSGDVGSIGVMATTLYVKSDGNTANYNRSASAHIIGLTTITGSTSISGLTSVYKSGSTVLDIQGSQGQLFSVIDALSGSLMSVNDISGLPIVEVFSDDRVVMGTYGAPAVIISGSNTVISGSLRGRVVTLSTASATASMDCSLSNFFDLTLSGSMYLTPTNILPGETINLRITQPATSGSLNYTSSIKFPNGLPYTASATSSVVDLVSFISFDSSTLYATAIKNLV